MMMMMKLHMLFWLFYTHSLSICLFNSLARHILRYFEWCHYVLKLKIKTNKFMCVIWFCSFILDFCICFCLFFLFGFFFLVFYCGKSEQSIWQLSCVKFLKAAFKLSFFLYLLLTSFFIHFSHGFLDKLYRLLDK